MRSPRSAELGAIADLCLRAKAVHGYDDRFLAACRPALQLSAHRLECGGAQVAVGADGALIGVVSVGPEEAGICDLELLFVEPTQHRRGVGRTLFRWAEARARGLGARTLEILADPGARAFYEAQGAIYRTHAPSDVIAGRQLPLLERALFP